VTVLRKVSGNEAVATIWKWRRSSRVTSRRAAERDLWCPGAGWHNRRKSMTYAFVGHRNRPTRSLDVLARVSNRKTALTAGFFGDLSSPSGSATIRFRFRELNHGPLKPPWTSPRRPRKRACWGSRAWSGGTQRSDIPQGAQSASAPGSADEINASE
jgi:hypothetical protein